MEGLYLVESSSNSSKVFLFFLCQLSVEVDIIGGFLKFQEGIEYARHNMTTLGWVYAGFMDFKHSFIGNTCSYILGYGSGGLIHYINN